MATAERAPWLASSKAPRKEWTADSSTPSCSCCIEPSGLSWHGQLSGSRGTATLIDLMGGRTSIADYVIPSETYISEQHKVHCLVLASGHHMQQPSASQNKCFKIKKGPLFISLPPRLTHEGRRDA